jgi:SAM-dependent methyltransferase
MAQAKQWDNEYKRNRLVTGSNEPQREFKRFLRYLKKNHHLTPDGLTVLDLGSGTGKNSLYLAEHGAIVTGYEIAGTAITIANERAKELGLDATFLEHNFGQPFPLPNNSVDLVLDIMASNSLTEAERAVYLHETARVLRPGGFCFVRLLARDGDKHAETLLTTNPGKETGTYILPEVGITERVLTKQEYIDYYSPLFSVLSLKRTSGYTRMSDRIFKRQYWVAYLQK